MRLVEATDCTSASARSPGRGARSPPATTAMSSWATRRVTKPNFQRSTVMHPPSKSDKNGGGRADRDEPSLAEPPDDVRAGRQLGAVRHDDRRLAAAPVFDDALDDRGRFDVEVGLDLVEQQDARIADDRAGERDAR